MIWCRHWMPMVVAILGLLSTALIVWTDRIAETHRAQFAFINALMDLRLRAAMSHLWLEEDIAGESGALQRASSNFTKTAKLAETILNGGDSLYGGKIPPLKDPELRKRAETVRKLISEFGAMTLSNPSGGASVSLSDHRDDKVFDELQRSAEELLNIVGKTHADDHGAWRRFIFWIFLSWCLIAAGTTTALFAKERSRAQAEQALRSANDELERRVAERTKQLTTLNETLKRELRDHEMAEEALGESEHQRRQLSFRLLTAQEMERRRISRELHDELGQALALIKLGITGIEKELTGEQTNAREECINLSQYVLGIMEEVRKLSRDLSPSVLDDLGLLGALRWLVNNHRSHFRATVTCSVDIDHLFASDFRIVIYRIVQEALTNVAKHARAQNVFITISELDDDRISVLVEDDGQGFDFAGESLRAFADKGLGLATMRERAQMLRGTIEVRSQKGAGTRVLLIVSKAKREIG